MVPSNNILSYIFISNIDYDLPIFLDDVFQTSMSWVLDCKESASRPDQLWIVLMARVFRLGVFRLNGWLLLDADREFSSTAERKVDG